jgi:hypothetical protein
MSLITGARNLKRKSAASPLLLTLVPVVVLLLFALAPLAQPIDLQMGDYLLFANYRYLHGPRWALVLHAPEGISFGTIFHDDWQPVALQIRTGRWMYVIGYYPPPNTVR